MTPAYLWFLSLISARTFIVAMFLGLGLRIVGKRQIGQINIYDLALIIALANAVQNAMTNGRGDLTVGIASASTLFFIGWALTLLFVKSPKLERQFIGTPSVLVLNGQMIHDRLRKECISSEQIMTALRQHGLSTLDQVHMVVLEVDGALSVIPIEKPFPDKNNADAAASQDENKKNTPAAHLENKNIAHNTDRHSAKKKKK